MEKMKKKIVHVYCTDANIFCKGLDAYLAEIFNDETQTLLETQVKLLPPSNWWLGASDEENVST